MNKYEETNIKTIEYNNESEVSPKYIIIIMVCIIAATPFNFFSKRLYLKLSFSGYLLIL